VSWLSLVGIGEDGVAGLGETARARIAEAEFVFGGNRHLDLVAGLATGIPEPWQSPIALSVDRIAQLSGRKVCVLASGDPFWFGIGATLVRTLPPADMQVFPAPSAFSLAAARLGWPLQDIFAVSAHGRPVSTIVPHLSAGARLLVLTSDGDGPVAIGRLLTESGFGDSALTVLEALGGPHERIVTTTAQDVSGRFADLNLVAIAVRAVSDARIIGLAPGRDESLFAHDGQISKGWARALTLAALSPRAGELLWDIGAGSGSVGIEWLLAGRDLRAVAIEADPVRAARIAENAERFGVQHLTAVTGRAPEALSGLDAPDAVFVGGGGSELGVMAAAIAALKPGGRLVANAVTLEMEATLLDHHARLGGTLERFTRAAAAPVGTMTGWRPAMPLTQWRWHKPAGAS
jgi:precorrin-6Y C5,15-methyltransferase (decarboxylating)